MASQSPEILGYRFAFGGGEVAERATADCTGKHFEMRREASEMIITPNHAFDSGGCRGACAEEPVMARPAVAERSVAAEQDRASSRGAFVASREFDTVRQVAIVER